MIKKGIWTFLAVVLLSVLAWHFFLKPYNYKITFTTKDPAGLVYSNLNAWLSVKGVEDSSKVTIDSQSTINAPVQRVAIKDSLFEYRWKLEPITDSTTKVTAYITDLNNRWIQNIYTPVAAVYRTDFVKRSLSTVKDLGAEWVDYRKRYKVGPISTQAVDSRYCAYVSVKTTATKKAASMMRNIADVMGYINNNELELEGDPFLQVKRWDRVTDSIAFDFCFPIKQGDNLPESKIVKFKQVPEFKGIKTIFNGNYSISDKSWYWLIRHAENNNIQVEQLPFEIYKNDPHMGGDALLWEAEVYLPIKNQ